MRTALWPREASGHDDEIEAVVRAPDDAGAAAFVALRAEGGLAGFVELRLRDFAEGCTSSPVAYVEGWWVDTDFRRRGVGEALMAAAEDWARRCGLRELASDCDVQNETSLRAHLALGFREAERVICLRKDL
jgi:aminoglycoside 6'-N-acetyltransferase I